MQQPTHYLHPYALTYFGIRVSPRLPDLFTLNFTPFCSGRPPMLDKLATFYHGQNIHYQNVLPKVNYLFTVTPIQPSTSWFKSLDSAIRKFYWKNKTPRIKLSTLQKPKTLGGLEAPNFTLYCLANHLQFVHRWTHPNQWLDLEQTICINLQISDLLFLSQEIRKHACFKAPTIGSSLTAWWKFHIITNTKPSPSKFTPICNNPNLTSHKKPLNSRTWKDKRITHLQHIFHNGKLSIFVDLVQKFGINNKHFLQYLQIKSSIKSTINTSMVNLELATPISQLINIPSSVKLLSKIYRIVTQIDTTTSLPSTKWESFPQMPISGPKSARILFS